VRAHVGGVWLGARLEQHARDDFMPTHGRDDERREPISLPIA
jgi:hypothetical protein